MDFNPILSEIQGHIQSMSPDAQAVVAKMGGQTTPSPAATAAVNAPSVIPPAAHGMLLPHPDTEPPAHISMDSPAPSLTMPTATPQLVTGPKRGQEMMSNGQPVHQGTLLGDQTELSRSLDEGPGINSIAHRIEGAMPNHPILGKILGWGAQIPAMVADTALESASPIARMALSNVPGTYAHQAMTLKGENRQIGQDTTNAQKEAQAGELQANAGHLTQETADMPAKDKSIEDYQGAETEHTNAETNNLKTGMPLEIHDTEAGPLLVNRNTGTAQHVSVDGQPVGPKLNLKESQPIMGSDGKPHTYMLDDKGQKVVDLGVHYERPAQTQGITMIVPNGQGGGTVERLTPGQTVAPGAQTAAGVNAVNTPTMQQRTASGRAATVVAMAPEVLARIDAIAPKLGPIEGRWNEFMQGKIGADDPDFAALRSDLLMMSSAVALAHAQGRLPENLREEFDHAINAPKQTPQNLKATITTMLPWLQKMQQQGKSNAPQGGDGAAENWGRGADGKLVKQ